MMITNMQIVNHVREDGLRVLAIFDFEKWGGPCQLVADVESKQKYTLGWMRRDQNGSWVRLNGAISVEAWGVYDKAMTELFGVDWRKIDDGTTRMLEWLPIKP